jgi:2'-5' RNA ligase
MNPPPGGRLAVDRADLMKSKLGPGGPVHTVSYESPLKG